MADLVITGANGFVGRHLLTSLEGSGQHIRALIRDEKSIKPHKGNIEWVVGDINNRQTWNELISPNCIVINLAYSQIATTDEAISTSRIMSEACSENSASRLIHCSTTSVYGRAAKGLVDETTLCHPTDSYGQHKLSVEQELLNCADDSYEVVILRPTSVFGPGGQALTKLCNSLSHQSKVTNYLRSSLFNNRRMHLVPVANVVTAISFLCQFPNLLHKEIFIISEDNDPGNNFWHIEDQLINYFDISPYRFPPLPIPASILKFLLLSAGKSEVDPKCNYSMKKLLSYGFIPPVTLNQAISELAARLQESQGRPT